MRLALVLLALAACAASPSPEPATPPEPTSAPAPLPRRASSHGEGVSCEAAMDEHAAAQAGAAASEEAVAAVKEALNRGTYLNRCQIASSAAVEVCVALMKSEVLGVTVEIDPGSQSEADCVAGEVRMMSYPESDSLILASTNFEPSLY